MEPDDGLFPLVVQNVKLVSLVLNDGLVELVALTVLLLVFGILIQHLLVHQLVNCWFEVESDIDELLSGGAKVGTGALLLEVTKFIQVVA